MLEVTLYCLFALSAAVTFVIAKQLAYALKHFSAPTRRSPLGGEVDLPSVTVCIPARNEQHALTDCLQQITASEYEKLEIIVLDDVSGDDTSALIKSFASEGVRFVKGQPLPDGWLGKNHALQGLLNEASGTYVLFLDVDTRLSPGAIENVVRYAISNKASMVSVLPRREDGWRASVLWSPLRYFWEVMFHRKLSPASASNAWLIRRDVLLKRFDGFETIKNAIQPEAKLADSLAVTGEYRFLMSSAAFGVAFEKKWRSQLVTSVRLLFPLLGHEMLKGFIALSALSLLLAPYVVIVVSYLKGYDFGLFQAAAVLLSASGALLYGAYARKVWSKGWFVGAILWPILIVQEMALVIASVIQYKRQTVKWKGRVIRPEARN